jgi:hypothetical protein
MMQPICIDIVNMEEDTTGDGGTDNSRGEHWHLQPYPSLTMYNKENPGQYRAMKGSQEANQAVLQTP